MSACVAVVVEMHDGSGIGAAVLSANMPGSKSIYLCRCIWKRVVDSQRLDLRTDFDCEDRGRRKD